MTLPSYVGSSAFAFVHCVMDPGCMTIMLHEEDVQGMLTQWAPHLMHRKTLQGQDLLAVALDWTSTDEALLLLGVGQDDCIRDDLSFGAQGAKPDNIWFSIG